MRFLLRFHACLLLIPQAQANADADELEAPAEAFARRGAGALSRGHKVRKARLSELPSALLLLYLSDLLIEDQWGLNVIEQNVDAMLCTPDKGPDGCLQAAEKRRRAAAASTGATNRAAAGGAQHGALAQVRLLHIHQVVHHSLCHTNVACLLKPTRNA